MNFNFFIIQIGKKEVTIDKKKIKKLTKLLEIGGRHHLKRQQHIDKQQSINNKLQQQNDEQQATIEEQQATIEEQLG